MNRSVSRPSPGELCYPHAIIELTPEVLSLTSAVASGKELAEKEVNQPRGADNGSERCSVDHLGTPELHDGCATITIRWWT